MKRSHVYVQRVEGAELIEHALRFEADAPTRGRVVEAAYLEQRGFVSRWLARLVGGDDTSTLDLAPPFDAEGNDAFDLFVEGASPLLEAHDPPPGEIRLVRGTVASLAPDPPEDGVVLRSLWVDRAPAIHACEAVEFAVVGEGSLPAVFSFHQAPLVVARPERRAISDFLRGMGSRARSLVRSMGLEDRGDDEGSMVSIAAGDRVEALVVVREEIPDLGSIAVGGVAMSLEALGGAPGYRAAAIRGGVFVGGLPGVRPVIRRVAGAAG
jgi:hypothetical protein